MRLVVVSVSHRQPGWVTDAFTEYTKRMPRQLRVELVEIRPERRPDNAGNAAIARLLAKEAERIRAALPKNGITVALDERGATPTTRQLADRLSTWMESSRDVALVIGSADGLDPAFLASASWKLSLSRLTLPHGLARVVVAEQCYRAWSLLRGHPYHRD